MPKKQAGAGRQGLYFPKPHAEPAYVGADAVIFTGGIGENSAEIRQKICEGLEWLGLELDPVRNAEHHSGREGLISKDDARLTAYVIPTDEELLIARDTVRCVRGAPQRY